MSHDHWHRYMKMAVRGRGFCYPVYQNFSRRLLFFDGSDGLTYGISRVRQRLEIFNSNAAAVCITRKSAHSCVSGAVMPQGIFRLAQRTRPYGTCLTQNCWKCGTEIDPGGEQYFCECGVIQPPQKERDYFKVLGLEKSFDINTMVLTKRFRDLQRNLHPDRFTQKTEEEKHFSEEQSSTVNRAYQTLLKPLPRGLYLLELEGHSIEDGEIQQDPEFLMEIMEVNESIAETSTAEGLNRLAKQNLRLLNELTVETSKAFGANDIPRAKALLGKLKYYANIDDRINELHRKSFGP